MATITKKTKPEDLTFKQRKWLRVYAETGNATEAARQSYALTTEGTYRAIGRENLARLDIASLMDEMGISDHKLLTVLDDGLKAGKQISAVIVGKNADERTEDFIEVPDHATRHKFLETAFKLKKHLAGSVTGEGVNVQTNIVNVLEREREEFNLAEEVKDAEDKNAI